jgi:hypothetical protein
MQATPHDEFREAYSQLLTVDGNAQPMDQRRAFDLKRQKAQEFRDQLMAGAPTNADEAGLRQLARQIRERKVVVKLFLRHPLHAKLYLLSRPEDNVAPLFAYLGSSNLTFAGLVKQGELNVDVLDQDACQKLKRWFEARWNDVFSIDISDELVEIIEESWAREALIPPYHIYLKIAYHLSREAREGLEGFQIPADLQRVLFDYQAVAVRIAAKYLNERGGVLLGDVVGLGKTIMATALARIFEEDFGHSTLIICPPNLREMWQGYADEYGLRARIVPLSMVEKDLQDVPARVRLVLIDESQNLRNREGKRYRAVQQYITESGSRCIMLSATPYNKSFLDLGSQLRLFVPEEQDLGIRPERLLAEIGETGFTQKFQASVRSLAAFERSENPDDWRDLMRLFLVRRTRGFIMDRYGETDPETGRKFLRFASGEQSFFPDRIPKTVKFRLDDNDPDDQYARLYSDGVVDRINSLSLPRYGLGNYIQPERDAPRSAAQKQIIDDLNRAGRRLMGFCRTNLFKRLESGGPAFLQSVERHILRNEVYLHALQTGQPLPIGSQDDLRNVLLFDPQARDEDTDVLDQAQVDEGDVPAGMSPDPPRNGFREEARRIYDYYRTQRRSRFKWLDASVTDVNLRRDLERDIKALTEVLDLAGTWDSRKDAKLQALLDLVQTKHPRQKLLVFSQFADTVRYLEQQFEARGVTRLEAITGDSPDPTGAAHRFSPRSNKQPALATPERETRVLIATDVLSEGQNLQDGHIVVNFDLPWAIIRLIQRAGRVDRIGQQSDRIYCYSFLPAEGVERIINLRGRVMQRLEENAEVVGADERFFDDELDDVTRSRPKLLDLYHERSGVLDEDEDESENDLASQALSAWQDALELDPHYETIIAGMPDVVYSTMPFEPGPGRPPGALVYVKTAIGSDSLAWVDRQGTMVSESLLRIWQTAACAPDTPALPRMEEHHDIVRAAARQIAKEQSRVGGQLGRPSSARRRVYDRLQKFVAESGNGLFGGDELKRAIEEIYDYPLQPAARNTLNRQLRSGIEDLALVDLVRQMYREDRLCQRSDGDQRLRDEPRIICSLGLKPDRGAAE